jgi:hypothetical protein
MPACTPVIDDWSSFNTPAYTDTAWGFGESAVFPSTVAPNEISFSSGHVSVAAQDTVVDLGTFTIDPTYAYYGLIFRVGGFSGAARNSWSTGCEPSLPGGFAWGPFWATGDGDWASSILNGDIRPGITLHLWAFLAEGEAGAVATDFDWDIIGQRARWLVSVRNGTYAGDGAVRAIATTPPAGWEDPAFDDSSWPIATGAAGDEYNQGFGWWTSLVPAAPNEVVSARWTFPLVPADSVPGGHPVDALALYQADARITVRTGVSILAAYMNGVAFSPTSYFDSFHIATPIQVYDVSVDPTSVVQAPPYQQVLALQVRNDTALDSCGNLLVGSPDRLGDYAQAQVELGLLGLTCQGRMPLWADHSLG